ncbi:axotactin-like [Ptychodera flava]|uniref:axotactin-like n=1 Tax=Ptychodera flava TaxID=63121 RepID=UPI003969EAD3
MRAPSALVLLLLLQASLSYSDDTAQTFHDPNLSYSEYRPSWRASDTQSVRFDFRTLLTDAMLVRHIVNTTISASQYTMGVALRKGQLQAMHVYGPHSDMILLGKGLHHDEWHSVTLTKTPSGNFSATLDGVTEWIQLNDGNIRGAAAELDKVESGTVSSVFVGGIKRRDGDNTGFSLNQYIGCIKNIQFSRDGHNYTTSDYVSTVGTKPGCIDQCEVHDDCKNGGECLNQYTGIICDCHGTGHEGAKCQNKGETTLTFYGSNFVEYFPYNASSTHHSSKNRVSLQFKMGTQDQDSGILFYNVGTPPNPNHLSISLINGRLNVSFDFGDEVYRLIDGSKLNDDSWHTVTVEHEEREVSLTLDGNTQSVDITGENYHLFMNPILYFGGGINMGRNQGLPTGKNFVGCMKNVHVGSINVFELFLKDDKRVAHFGGEPSYGCNTIEFSPITFPTFKSQLILHSWQYPSDLKMSFQFRTQQRDALVLMVGIRVGNDTKTSGSIRLLLKNGRMQVHLDLSLEDGDDSFEYWTYAGKNLHDKEWHSCTIEAMLVDGEVTLQLDNEFVFIRSDRAFIRRRGGIYPVTDIYLGGGLHNQERGFVGCVRHLVIQGREVNPLETISSGEANGVILDGCKMKDLCVGVTKCEHQSECIQDWYQTYCDCDGTGYNGTVCHFPTAKRSCEDYYQMGFRQSGVRRIDPDGAGPLPPSYVYCEMLDQPIGYAGTKTIIDHNLRNSTLVRKFGQMNMKKVLEYRDMSSESLVHLVENSINCTQELTYECLKSPQYLGNQTWYLAANGKLFDTDAGFTKNCNKNDLKKRQDTAVLENPLHVPVTEMFFMQQRNKEVAEGRVSLSPLTCLGSKLYDPENAVTFTDESSNLMLDAWESGDLSFSFRTLQRDATLLFQEPPRHDSDYVMIEVVDGSSIIFKFNTGKREANATVRAKSLNDGNWHYVSVEYNQYHVRFTVDTVTSWFNLIKDEEFGPFTGPLYVGGMSSEYANVIPGLEGCFRNLVIDNKLIKLPDFIGIGVNGSSVTEGVKKDVRDRVTQIHARMVHSVKNCGARTSATAQMFLTEGFTVKKIIWLT